jgi:hypothetical protein
VEVRGMPALARPDRVDVTVSGPASALAALTAADLHAFVDHPAAAGGRAKVAVEIAAGHAGVEVDGTAPAEVLLRASAAAGAR